MTRPRFGWPSESTTIARRRPAGAFASTPAATEMPAWMFVALSVVHERSAAVSSARPASSQRVSPHSTRASWENVTIARWSRASSSSLTILAAAQRVGERLARHRRRNVDDQRHRERCAIDLEPLATCGHANRRPQRRRARRHTRALAARLDPNGALMRLNMSRRSPPRHV